MASKVDIFNMALSHIGGKTVLNAEENSAEALVCRTFYNTARDEVLSDGDWPFARKNATLALISENPTPDWLYSYGYPADCLRALAVPFGREVAKYQYRYVRSFEYHHKIPFEIYYGDTAKEIYCNMSDARLIYTRRIENEEGRFPVEFVVALSYALAAFIAPRVVGAENYEIVQLMEQMAKIKVDRSVARRANQEQEAVTQDSGFTRARE